MRFIRAGAMFGGALLAGAIVAGVGLRWTIATGATDTLLAASVLTF